MADLETIERVKAALPPPGEHQPIDPRTIRAIEHDENFKPQENIGYDQGDWRGNPAKEGVDTDDCRNPACGARDVLPMKIAGGRDGRGEEHRLWTMFQCSCCGTTWDVTTAEGAAYDARHGRPTRRLTASADRGRVISVPSRAYMSNYDRAFQKGPYSPAAPAERLG